MDAHLRVVVSGLKQGRVVPFLGAGANLCARVEGALFNAAATEYLPNGAELARYLADMHGYALPDLENLLRVAQYIEMTEGEGPLYDSLRELFDHDYPSTPLHDLLASLPRRLRDRGWTPLQLIVTTNYDDLLERAFRAADEPFDVITYMTPSKTPGKERARFLHVPPDGPPTTIEKGTANTYLLPQDDRGNLLRPAILKLHGAVDRLERERDSYVITESDYIEYIAGSDVQALIPTTLLAKLRYSNFLFLGYSLRDWNVRAILHQIWALQQRDYRSWAIQHEPDEFDRLAWDDRGVQIFAQRLDGYIEALAAVVEQLPARATSVVA